MLDFLAALRGLTMRGRCFLAAGTACCGSSIAVGEKDLFRVGLLLLALPLFAAAFVCRTRYRLACTRRLDPARASVGGSVSASIRIDNMSRRSSSVLLMEDHIPDRLGYRARFVLDRVDGGGTRELSYELRAQLRGRYLIGPMSIRLSDPFGLCEISRAFRSRDELIITPAVEVLPRSRPGGRVTISNHRGRSTPTVGGDDSSTRPYQPGDDLRRVHWRTSARAGALMVRRDESVRSGTTALLLDTRADAWFGTGRTASWIGGGPMSSFEWAVSAAASIAVHLTATGQEVRLVCRADGGTGITATATATGSSTALLDELADVRTTAPASLRALVGRARIADSGMLVAILGRTDPAEAAILAGTRSRGLPAIAVLVDVATWSTDRSTDRDQSVEACRTVFRRHGWTVIIAGCGDKLADLWPHASGRDPGALGASAPGAGRDIPAEAVTTSGNPTTVRQPAGGLPPTTDAGAGW